MATIIKRPDGRIEIRESAWTPEGPRSRTLAISKRFTDELLNHAAQRATGPIDRDRLVERARTLGIHHSRTTQPDAVPALVERARTAALWPTHARAIRTLLRETDDVPLPDHLEAMTEWMGADDETRGRALVDLLKLTEAVMQHRPESRRVRERLTFPSLRHCKDR
jgi:hypothetical protein